MEINLNFVWQCVGSLLLLLGIYFAWFSQISTKLYLLFICAGLLLLRLPSFMVGEFFSNDEGEWISGAYSYLTDGKFWQEVDTSTSGPLVFMIPISVVLSGLKLDYATIRIFGVIFSLIPTLCFLYYALIKLFDLTIAKKVILIIWISVGFTSCGDIMGYNSEAIPTLLYAIAIYLFATLKNQFTNSRMLLIGLCLGLLFWAKPQAVITGGIGAACLMVYLFLTQRSFKTYCYFILGGLIPSVVCLTYIFSNGLWYFFFNRFIKNNFLQALSGLPIATHARSYIFSYFWTLPEMRLLLVGAVVFPIVIVLVVRRKFLTWTTLCCCVLFLSGVWSLLQTANFFEHYKVLILVQSALIWALILAYFKDKLIIFQNVIVGLLLITGFYQIYQGSFLSTYQPMDTQDDLKLISVLNQLKQPNDRLAIWGGKSNLYVVTGMLRGCADAHTTYAITRTGELGTFYQTDFLQKLEERKTRFVIDPISKGFWRDKFGHTNYPNINKYLQSHYSLYQACDAYVILIRK